MVCLVVSYGRLLSTKIMIMPMTATNTNSPAIAGTKYVSAIDAKGVAADVGVGAAGSTAKDVIAFDGQYDSLPAKLA